MIPVTKAEIDACVRSLTREDQDRMVGMFAPSSTFSREAKLAIGAEEIVCQRKEAAAGLRNSTLESLAARVRELEARPQGITAAQLKKSEGAIVKAVGDAVAEFVAAELQRMCVMTFKGTWVHDAEYVRGSAVVHDGGIWVALDQCKGERPGSGSTAWRLAARGPGKGPG